MRRELNKEVCESAYLKNGLKRSVSASQLVANSNQDLCEGISSASAVPTERELLYLIGLIKPLVGKLFRKYPEVAANKLCLNRWERFLKVNVFVNVIVYECATGRKTFFSLYLFVIIGRNFQIKDGALVGRKNELRQKIDTGKNSGFRCAEPTLVLNYVDKKFSYHFSFHESRCFQFFSFI